MLPHHTSSLVFASATVNLSLGDRPVNFPVSPASAPVLVILPSPRATAESKSWSNVRFLFVFYFSGVCFFENF